MLLPVRPNRGNASHGNGASESSRERVLQGAEELFNEFGYSTVTVHQIAKKLGIKAASLYYHAPGGKEELFVLVLKRCLARHRRGMRDALAGAGSQLRDQCLAVIEWFLSQGPLAFFRLLVSDLGGLKRGQGDRLRQLAIDSLVNPISHLFQKAAQQGEIRAVRPYLLTCSILAMVDGIWYASEVQAEPVKNRQMAEEFVDLLLNGARP